MPGGLTKYLSEIFNAAQTGPELIKSTKEDTDLFSREISWIRYNYLISHLPQRKKTAVPPPEDREIAKLWWARQRKYQAFVKSHRKYLEKVEQAVLASSKNREELEKKLELGRTGNVALRRAISDIMILYQHISGKTLKTTRGGILFRIMRELIKVEFSSLKFITTDYVDLNNGDIRVYMAGPVHKFVPPNQDQVRDTARALLAKRKLGALDLGPRSVDRFAQFQAPEAVTGFFFSAEEGEKWEAKTAKIPPLFRVPYDDALP